MCGRTTSTLGTEDRKKCTQNGHQNAIERPPTKDRRVSNALPPPATMIPLDPPRFPVIIPTPSLTDAVKNFRVTEYLSVGAVTTASGVFG